MSGSLIEIKIDDREVRELFRQLQRRTSNLTPVMKVIGETIRRSVIQNFLVGGRYSEEGSWRGGNRKWKELSPATLKTKSNKGRILIEEENLMSSIHPRPYRDHVVVGTNRVYAAIHQFGGPAGRIGYRFDMPARPFLVVQDEDMQEIKEVIRDHIMNV